MPTAAETVRIAVTFDGITARIGADALDAKTVDGILNAVARQPWPPPPQVRDEPTGHTVNPPRVAVTLGNCTIDLAADALDADTRAAVVAAARRRIDQAIAESGASIG